MIEIPSSPEPSGGRVFVVGVGMTNFLKPSKDNPEYFKMAAEAGRRALADAGIGYVDLDQVVAGYCFGDSTCGQRSAYEIGMTGIPVVNVNNNCATGSTAIYVAQGFVAGGMASCVLALGFEKMNRGSLGSVFDDRENPVEKHFMKMGDIAGMTEAPPMAQMFGNAASEHMEKHGTTPLHLAKIAEKNHRHSANNPYSQFRQVHSLDEVLKSRKVHGPLTKLQCCPTSDGAAAAIICSEAFIIKHGLQATAVEIKAMSLRTDTGSTFADATCMRLVGYEMSKQAAEECYRRAGVRPEAVDVVELHDCFSANEMITYEAIGLCPEGGAGAFIDRGDNTYGGRVVVNPSGGLISKGHPLGATGVAQCAELCWQLRGECGARQVKGAKVALQHNIGLGGAGVVAVYERPAFAEGSVRKGDASGALGFGSGRSKL